MHTISPSYKRPARWISLLAVASAIVASVPATTAAGNSYYPGPVGGPIGEGGVNPQTGLYYYNASPSYVVGATTHSTHSTQRGYTITGTAGDDVIVGTPGDDIIYGLAGNDTIRGLGGDDVIVGGAGNDTLVGGGGWDRLYGGSGDDVLVARDGRADDLRGESGHDQARYDSRLDSLHGVEER